MEKLGVEVDGDQVKAASEGEGNGICPICEQTLLPLEEGNVPRCPQCGTKPFEGNDAA